MYLGGSSSPARVGGVAGAGTSSQGFLNLNGPNPELLVGVCGCSVSVAAENRGQVRGAVLCLALDLPDVPETSNCPCNLNRIWRTWRRMKKQTLKKVMKMSRKSKRTNCKEKTDLHHPKNQTLNWLLLCSPVSQKPIKI